MFLRATKRIKDGKAHHYYSVVENGRLHDGKTVQKTVLYLGEISDAQRASWCEAIEVSKGGERRTRQLKLFASDSGFQ